MYSTYFEPVGSINRHTEGEIFTLDGQQFTIIETDTLQDSETFIPTPVYMCVSNMYEVPVALERALVDKYGHFLGRIRNVDYRHHFLDKNRSMPL